MGWRDQERRRKKGWQAGYRSGLAGQSSHSNPYNPGTPEYEGWKNGHFVGETERGSK